MSFVSFNTYSEIAETGDSFRVYFNLSDAKEINASKAATHLRLDNSVNSMG